MSKISFITVNVSTFFCGMTRKVDCFWFCVVFSENLDCMGNIFELFFVFIGTQISQVPVVARQPLDLFKFFTVVRDRGGLQEVSLFNKNSPHCG